MEKSKSEILFYTDESGVLQLLSMCVTAKPEAAQKPKVGRKLSEELTDHRFQIVSKFSHAKRVEKHSELCFCIGNAEEEKSNSEEVLDKFKDQTKSLMDMGFTDEQIMQIIQECRKRTRILIDKHFRIFLLDEQKQEVEMNPLSKTLFLFYLKHPEGVALKCLSDYKTELNHIYSHLTGRESIEDREKSIRDIIDPTSNSVHEKCSRIKAAFKGKVSSSTLTDYVPSGTPGEARFISLDRNLVTWEGSL